MVSSVPCFFITKPHAIANTETRYDKYDKGQVRVIGGKLLPYELNHSPADARQRGAKGDRNFLPFHNPSVRLFLLVFVCQITYLLGCESCVTDYLSHGGSLVTQPDNDVLLLLPF